MVVEELLELLVDKVDGDLLKAVIFKDLETGDVEHGAEVGLLQSGVDEGVLRGIYSDEVVLGGNVVVRWRSIIFSHLHYTSRSAT